MKDLEILDREFWNTEGGGNGKIDRVKNRGNDHAKSLHFADAALKHLVAANSSKNCQFDFIFILTQICKN